MLRDKDLVQLVQGRLGELKKPATARRYDALRYQLDKLHSNDRSLSAGLLRFKGRNGLRKGD